MNHKDKRVIKSKVCQLYSPYLFLWLIFFSHNALSLDDVDPVTGVPNYEDEYLFENIDALYTPTEDYYQNNYVSPAYIALERIGNEALSERIYSDIFITSSGTKIGFTLLQPRLDKNKTAPLIMHSHGYGSGRISPSHANTGTNDKGKELGTTESQALQLWHAGYWVLSIDQAGYGDSDNSQSSLMSKDYELYLMQGILNYIQDINPRLSYIGSDHTVTNIDYPKDDLLLGTVGGSYGGAYQLLLANFDKRVKVIVPSMTWNNLNDSLAPNGIVKYGWASLLVILGSSEISDVPLAGLIAKLFPQTFAYVQRRLNPVLSEMYYSFLYNRRMVQGGEYFDYLNDRSFMKYSGICSGSQTYQADSYTSNTYTPENQPLVKQVHYDALFFQGMRDTLFPINEAYKNHACLKANGSDSRLIGVQNGHVIPLLQSDISKSDMRKAISPTFYCSGVKYNTNDVAQKWFDGKLKYRNTEHGENLLNQIPTMCLTLEENQGVNLEEMPRAESQWMDIGEVKLETSSGAIWSAVDALGDYENAIHVDDPWYKNLDLIPDVIQPRFTPVLQAEDHVFMIAGIPKVKFSISREWFGYGTDLVAYVGVGVREEGGKVKLIDDQVMPIRGDFRSGDNDMYFNADLIGVGERIEAGEEVGLLFYGYRLQYNVGQDYNIFDSILHTVLPQAEIIITGSASMPVVEYEEGNPYVYKPIDMQNKAIGDFNGDGVDDIFRVTSSGWWVSYSGRGGWELLKDGAFTTSEIEQYGFADFNNDGKTDVFFATGSSWWIAYSGTDWKKVKTDVSAQLSNLAFGDIDGDGFTDVIHIHNNYNGIGVRYGTGVKASVNSSNNNVIGSNYPLLSGGEAATQSKDKYLFDDFNVDGKTDILYLKGSDLWIADGGKKWYMAEPEFKTPVSPHRYDEDHPSEYTSSPIPLNEIATGDFDGDNIPDILYFTDLSFDQSDDVWQSESELCFDTLPSPNAQGYDEAVNDCERNTFNGTDSTVEYPYYGWVLFKGNVNSAGRVYFDDYHLQKAGYYDQNARETYGIGDFNGDDVLDVLFQSDSSSAWWVAHKAKNWSKINSGL